MHEKAMLLLKNIYDHHLKHPQGSFSLSISQLEEYSQQDQDELISLFEYLKAESYIRGFAECKTSPISVKITSAGIKKIEGIKEEPSIMQQTITVGTNNGVIGNNASGNTINNNFSTFDEYKALIEQNVKSIDEQKKLIEALQPLFDMIKVGAPLQKGILCKAWDCLKENAWLSSPLAVTLINYLADHIHP